MKKHLFLLLFAIVASISMTSAAITVRLDPQSCSSWSTVRLWAWTSAGNVFNAWPGEIVSKDGDGWYAYTFDESITEVSIIWNNGTAQTIDITGITASTCYALNSTSGTTITVRVVDCPTNVDPEPEPLYSRTVRLDSRSCTGWSNVYLWAWTDNGNIFTAWPGVKVSLDANGWYSYTFTFDEYEQGLTIIWSDGNGNQTEDIAEAYFYDCYALNSTTGNAISVMKMRSSGSCGYKIEYEYSIENKTLEIQTNGFSNTGKMDDFSYAIPAPWDYFRKDISQIIIGNGITRIGDLAFYGCSSITSVTIPNSVTRIGEAAFYDCSSLTSATIGNSVTSIGNEAFGYCSSLTSVTIPNSVTSIGDGAFRNCSSLTSITIPNSVTSIGAGTFRYCRGLTSVTIPNSVTSIGNEAFWSCDSLTSVTIPNSVTSIGQYAFIYCSSLTSVTIPNSVTSIGKYAFIYCSSLTSIIVETGNTAYDSRDNCNALIETSTNTLITGCQNTTIPNSVTSIENYAFSGCSSLPSVTIPNSVTSIGNHAFYYCTSLTSATIPNSMTSIGEKAFYGCSGLTSIEIPASVNEIEKNAFNTLKKVTINSNAITSQSFLWEKFGDNVEEYIIGEGVTNIGNRAFDESDRHHYEVKHSLSSITLPSSITNIEETAFICCYNLKSVHISDLETWCNVTFNDPHSQPCVYGANLYVDEELITDLAIPNTITQIGKYSFEGCNISSVIIPDNVTQIGEWAFMNCDYLKSITIGSGVSDIYSSAFSGNDSLNSVTCLATIPPTTDGTAFSYKNRSQIPLYVPQESINLYRTAYEWQDFQIRHIGYVGFEITFKNWDGTILQSLNTEQGYMPEYTGEIPTRPEDDYYTYTFNGWTPEIVVATEDATYTAVYNTNSKPNYYTIQFINWNGDELQKGQVLEGEMPQYAGLAPTRPDDENYTYEFSGWTPEIVPANEDATYTATYEESQKAQVGFESVVEENLAIRMIINNGQLLILRDGKTYTVQGQEVR